jgi:hypothetical protein
VGTDLNRNYGYRWGNRGRTSSNPEAITYHGPRAFSAPETRAMRDFLASRVVGGRQQIRAAVSFHEYGRLVMWPYGYTLKNVPADMTRQDHAALARMGRHMAATNGYRPQQGSDLYVTSGTSRDYLYGTYRIMGFTFELSIRDYPRSRKIAPETGRNKEAVLWLAERAWCPLAVLGADVRTARCGAFDDDLEVARGWTVNPDGTDTAPSSGRWSRGNPAGTTLSGHTLQPTGVPSGSSALVTGRPGRVVGDGLRPRRPHDGPLDPRDPARRGRPGADLPLPVGHGASATADDHARDRRGRRDADGGLGADGAPSLLAGTWRSASVPMDAWVARRSASGSRPPTPPAHRPSRRGRRRPGHAADGLTCRAPRRHGRRPARRAEDDLHSTRNAPLPDPRVNPAAGAPSVPHGSRTSRGPRRPAAWTPSTGTARDRASSKGRTAGAMVA